MNKEEIKNKNIEDGQEEKNEYLKKDSHGDR